MAMLARLTSYPSSKPDKLRRRLHIRCAAAPEIIAFDAWNELRVIGFGFDNIKVTCQQRSGVSWPSDSPVLEREMLHIRRILAIKEFHIQASIAQIIIDQRTRTMDFIRAFIGAGCDRWNADQLLGQIKNFSWFYQDRKFQPQPAGVGGIEWAHSGALWRAASRPRCRNSAILDASLPRDAIFRGNAFHISS